MSVPFLQANADNKPIYVHRSNGLYVILRLILSFLVTIPLIVIIIAGGIQVTIKNEWDGLNVLWFLIFLALFMVCWYDLFFPIARNFGKKIEVYPHALIVKRWKKQTTIPFDELAQIHTKWRIKTENLMVKTKALKVRLVLKDGSDHTFNWAINHLERLEAFLQQALTERVLPQAIQTVQQGQTVSFDDEIHINRDGVTTNKGTLAWPMVMQAYFNKKNLMIVPKGQAGAWDWVNINKIPNRMLLEALINTLAR